MASTSGLDRQIGPESFRKRATMPGCAIAAGGKSHRGEARSNARLPFTKLLRPGWYFFLRDPVQFCAELRYRSRQHNYSRSHFYQPHQLASSSVAQAVPDFQTRTKSAPPPEQGRARYRPVFTFVIHRPLHGPRFWRLAFMPTGERTLKCRMQFILSRTAVASSTRCG